MNVKKLKNLSKAYSSIFCALHKYILWVKWLKVTQSILKYLHPPKLIYLERCLIVSAYSFCNHANYLCN